jgi:hypothetical protein
MFHSKDNGANEKLHGGVELILGKGLDFTRGGRSGIVEETIKAPVCFAGMIHRSFDLSFVHDIGSEKSCVGAKLLIEACTFFFVAPSENDLRTFAYEKPDSRLTNSAGTACDEGNLSI